MKKFRVFAVFSVFLTMFLLYGCKEKPKFGNVHFDRDTCEHCKMVVSDRNFSVDVAVDDRHYYFDDFGCMVSYMVKNDKLSWLQQAQIYINDAKTGEFIDAKMANFYHGYNSPMAFGWGALKQKIEGKEAFSLEQAVQKIKSHASLKMHSGEPK